MDFLLLQTNLNAILKRLNRESYNYGTSGDYNEFQLVSITSDEIQIDSYGLSRDGVASPNIVIRNQNVPDYPLSIKVRDEDGNWNEVACGPCSGAFNSFHKGMLQAFEWIIDNLL